MSAREVVARALAGEGNPELWLGIADEAITALEESGYVVTNWSTSTNER